jgi:hypothetical protein
VVGPNGEGGRAGGLVQGVLLSRAIFLNQHDLPGYLFREVSNLNAWRASQKLLALLVCYDFFKLSNHVRTDSPVLGNMCDKHAAASVVSSELDAKL